MAIRQKTVEYVFQSEHTQVASAATQALSGITLYVPETGSRAFKSVALVLFARDDQGAAATLSDITVGLSLGAAAPQSYSAASFGATGEAQSWHFLWDVTGYFAANFGTGTSQTCGLTVTPTGPAINYYTAKLVITYEFQDSAATTRLKTVRIPIQSHQGTLPTALTTLGTGNGVANVPALDTYLPEAGKVYRQKWFEMEAQTAGFDSSTFSLRLALDAEAEVIEPGHNQTMATGLLHRRVWVRDDMDPATTHEFKVRASATNKFPNLGAFLCVTYEYNHSTTTTVMNSVIVPMDNPTAYFGSTGDQQRLEGELWVEEPGTITIKDSAAIVRYHPNGTGTITMRAGAQADKTYSGQTASSTCGGTQIVHRLDTDGSGITLARGRNTFSIDLEAVTPQNTNGFVGAAAIVNYTSGKASAGADAHNKSVFQVGQERQNTSNIRHNPVTPYKPANEASAFLQGVAVEMNWQINRTDFGMTLSVERQAGEGPGAGFLPVGSWHMTTDNELVNEPMWVGCRGQFRRYAGDPDPARVDYWAARDWRLEATGNPGVWYGLWATYHCLTFTVSGTVNGYSSTGAGIAVRLHDATTGELRLSGTTTTGGAYSLTWYDSARQVYVDARQDDTRVGRSPNGNAT